MPADVNATLNYSSRSYERGFFYARELTEADKHKDVYSSGEKKSIEKIVKDARDLGMKLDDCSFELVNHETSLSLDEFYNDHEKVSNIYYEEVKELLKKETGAEFVRIFHHQLRCDEKANNTNLTDINTTVQPYAKTIHSDSSKFSAEELFRGSLLTTSDPERFSKGRFMYINVWRNIADEPIENNHLAMCDERSLVSPDDYILFEFHGPGYKILQHLLDHANSDQHKWYYFPKMKKNEAILFKQWDSDITKSSRCCFHTAFTDPTASSNGPPRQSIEVRAVVFFPDHTPNTCPVVQDVKQYSEDQYINGAVLKLLFIVSDLNSFPMAVLYWIKFNLKKGEKGIRTILTELVRDKKGFFGTKGFSEEKKKEIVNIILNDTDFEKMLRKSFGTIEHRVALKNISFNINLTTATISTLVTIALGFGLGTLFVKKFNW